MEGLTIKQEWLDAARKAGACSDAFTRYYAGDPVSKVAFNDLIWFEKYVKITIELPPADVGHWPIWALGSGSGDGGGYGSGYGYGDGSGSGYGSGYGYGYGYSGGYGSGYGYGYGYGYGSGDQCIDIVQDTESDDARTSK